MGGNGRLKAPYRTSYRRHEARKPWRRARPARAMGMLFTLLVEFVGVGERVALTGVDEVLVEGLGEQVVNPLSSRQVPLIQTAEHQS